MSLTIVTINNRDETLDVEIQKGDVGEIRVHFRSYQFIPDAVETVSSTEIVQVMCSDGRVHGHVTNICMSNLPDCDICWDVSIVGLEETPEEAEEKPVNFNSPTDLHRSIFGDITPGIAETHGKQRGRYCSTYTYNGKQIAHKPWMVEEGEGTFFWVNPTAGLEALEEVMVFIHAYRSEEGREFAHDVAQDAYHINLERGMPMSYALHAYADGYCGAFVYLDNKKVEEKLVSLD